MTEKKNNRISIIIILLLLALVIYYVSKQLKPEKTIEATFKCCTVGNEFYSGSCEADPNCSCDNTLCQEEWVENPDEIVISVPDDPILPQTYACCEGVAYNYDPACLTDPNCNCDMSLCTSTPQTPHTCYTNCNNNGGYGSLLTTIPCGTGGAAAYPNTNAPYCANNQA